MALNDTCRLSRKSVAWRQLAMLAGVLLVGLSPAAAADAGSCTSAVDRVQAEIDAQLESMAARGRTGRESVGAMLHHQPTPGSIARAEAQLGDGSQAEHANAELRRAREFDQAGNQVDCERAVARARRLIGK